MILNQKLIFCFFDLDDLKHFIIQDNRKVIKKILFGTEQMTRPDNKINLFNIRFNLNAWKIYLKKSLMH